MCVCVDIDGLDAAILRLMRCIEFDGMNHPQCYLMENLIRDFNNSIRKSRMNMDIPMSDKPWRHQVIYYCSMMSDESPDWLTNASLNIRASFSKLMCALPDGNHVEIFSSACVNLISELATNNDLLNLATEDFMKVSLYVFQSLL